MKSFFSAALWVLTAIPAFSAPKTPNILLILADDLGYDDIRCYNPASKVPPPHRPPRSAQLASLTDVMATLATITGTELPNAAAGDSFNLLPAFEAKASASIRTYLVTQAFHGAHTLSIRRGDWKYINHPGSGGNPYVDDTLFTNRIGSSPCK